MDNFDLRNFLTENKLTTNSKLLAEQVDEVNWKGLAAGAAMTLGTLGAHGQEAPKQRDYQKSIDSLKTVTDKTPQEKRALTADFVKKRNAQRLAPIEAAQKKRIENWIAANPGPEGESYEDGAKRYWKDQERRQSGPDVGLDGLQGPNFSHTSCPISKANAKQDRRDWSKK